MKQQAADNGEDTQCHKAAEWLEPLEAPLVALDTETTSLDAMTARIVMLHGAVILALFLLQFVASDYAVLTITRIMVLAIYALGYNILFGYAGLLSLGHAMFFATGLYAAALGVTRLGLAVPEAFVFALVCGIIVSVVIGLVAVIASLFSALFFLYRDRGQGTRMLRALALRVALSAVLVGFLVLSYRMGWIAPTGMR